MLVPSTSLDEELSDERPTEDYSKIKKLNEAYL